MNRLTAWPDLRRYGFFGIVLVALIGATLLVRVATHHAEDDNLDAVPVRLAVTDLSAASLVLSPPRYVDLVVTGAAGDAGRRHPPFQDLLVIGHYAADGRLVLDGEERPAYLILCTTRDQAERLRVALREKTSLDLVTAASPSPSPSPSPAPDALDPCRPAAMSTSTTTGATTPTPVGIPIPATALKTDLHLVRDGPVTVVLVFPSKTIAGSGETPEVARYRGTASVVRPPTPSPTASPSPAAAADPTAAANAAATATPTPSPAPTVYVVPDVAGDPGGRDGFIRRLHGATAVYLVEPP